jgi:hypothetical protein
MLATGACQVHSEDGYCGHLVLRLMGCLVLFYTSRVICKGRMTIEEIIFSLKHCWHFVESEALELQALASKIGEKAASTQVKLRGYPETSCHLCRALTPPPRGHGKQ